MRGDAGLAARLLLRRGGLAAILVGLGGCLAFAGALQPWHVLTADVDMLGGVSRATLPGAGGPDTWQAWASIVPAVALVVFGLLLALDRAPHGGRPAAMVCAALLAVLAVSALVVMPDPESLAPERAADVFTVAEELPVGVGLRVHATATAGPWLAVAGATVAVLGAILSREH